VRVRAFAEWGHNLQTTTTTTVTQGVCDAMPHSCPSVRAWPRGSQMDVQLCVDVRRGVCLLSVVEVVMVDNGDVGQAARVS
jgi:hypothetical protein